MVSNRESMRSLSCLLVLCLMSATWLSAQPKTAPSPAQAAAAPVLPTGFSGWDKTNAIASPVSAADAKVLKEFGLAGTESATYQRGDRKMQVKALRFPDATGAYGAFTYFRKPSMATEKLCDQGASEDTQVFFYCSNVLLAVTLDKVTVMTPAELRELAAAIPRVRGNLAEMPRLPMYLSEPVRLNAHYVAGPAGLDQLNGVVRSNLIDFTLSPEVIVAKEPTDSGEATVVVIQYPTPKIAQAQLQKINDWAATQHADWAKTQTIAPAASADVLPTRFATRRSGPIVSVVSGQITDATARKILSDINYDAEVTWSEATGNSPKDNIGNLVYNIMLLAFIIGGFMFVIGFAFGGFRIAMKRFFPGKIVDRPEDVDFIKLNLR